MGDVVYSSSKRLLLANECAHTHVLTCPRTRFERGGRRLHASVYAHESKRMNSLPYFRRNSVLVLTAVSQIIEISKQKQNWRSGQFGQEDCH